MSTHRDPRNKGLDEVGDVLFTDPHGELHCARLDHVLSLGPLERSMISAFRAQEARQSDTDDGRVVLEHEAGDGSELDQCHVSKGIHDLPEELSVYCPTECSIRSLLTVAPTHVPTTKARATLRLQDAEV